jgi:hypothetical protein
LSLDEKTEGAASSSNQKSVEKTKIDFKKSEKRIQRIAGSESGSDEDSAERRLKRSVEKLRRIGNGDDDVRRWIEDVDKIMRQRQVQIVMI